MQSTAWFPADEEDKLLAVTRWTAALAPVLKLHCRWQTDVRKELQVKCLPPCAVNMTWGSMMTQSVLSWSRSTGTALSTVTTVPCTAVVAGHVVTSCTSYTDISARLTSNNNNHQC